MKNVKISGVTKVSCAIAFGVFVCLSILYFFLINSDSFVFANLIISCVLAAFVGAGVLFLDKARCFVLDILVLSRNNRIVDFQDGQKVSVTGTIQSTNVQYVLSPFTRSNSVLYKYSVHHLIRSGHDRDGDPDSTVYNDYIGYVMMPTVLKIDDFQNVNVLGISELIGFHENNFNYSPKNLEIYQNAQSYINSRRYPDAEYNPQIIPEMEREIHKIQPGNWILLEKSGLNQKFDLRKTSLTETCVPNGSVVTVIGSWSTQNNGILNDNLPDGKLTIINGSLSVAKRRLFFEALGTLILALLLIIVPNLIIYLGHLGGLSKIVR